MKANRMSVRVTLAGVEDTDQSSRLRLKYGFVEFETYIEWLGLKRTDEVEEKSRNVLLGNIPAIAR